ncbi:M24 family metallopeptidase [Actinotalea sp. Marseille-Q4924]|uniref:M24 family metallopeptidase n=1 Tax=Actinotalea sp. Marseille-Q4924 TaxID=2866571 RepID=UPI001CE3D87D|nr:M24 family metallopeptidase [Actinotalea sp. Marseille-Q4924]
MTGPGSEAQPPAGLVAAQSVARQTVSTLMSRGVRAGASEIELAERVATIVGELGASGLWTPCTTRVGLGALVAHPEFPMQQRRAAAGDYLVLDVAPAVQGWLGDYCRTFVVGGGPDAHGLIGEVERIQAALIDHVRPGMPANELFAFGAALVAGAGLKVLDLLDNIGHSIGREFAADGFIDASNDTPMWGAWTIEPHVGTQARGVKVEDMLWLPRHGPAVVL